MDVTKSPHQDPLAKLFTGLRPTAAELAKLKAAEADPKQFSRLLAELDRKYKVRSIDTLGLDKKLINTQAFLPAGAAEGFEVQAGLGVVAQLLQAEQACPSSTVPFAFRGLEVYNNMAGPEQTDVARGMLGAMRWGANEYTVWNPGDTRGTTRVHLYGEMQISFGAVIPQAGRWCLVHPSGSLLIRGHSRVVGHGNSTTSYDAKVWIDYYQVLTIGGTVIEISGGEVFYDGTRSEDRTRSFNADSFLPPRGVTFDAPRAGDTLLLALRIDVDTAANEDGLATGVIDQFGFLANSTDDYDTLVVKAG